MIEFRNDRSSFSENVRCKMRKLVAMLSVASEGKHVRTKLHELDVVFVVP